MACSPNPTPPSPPTLPGVAWGPNPLALLSFLLSLVFPIGLLLVLMGGRGFIATGGPPTPLWYSVGRVLELVGIPALIAASGLAPIVLRRAHRDSLHPACAGLALFGVTFSLVLLLGYVAVVLWYLTHPYR